MKTKLIFSIIALSFTTLTFAQGLTTENQKSGAKTAFKPTGFGDNWFIELGAGAQMPVAEHFEHVFSTEAITVAPTFSFGKWFKPYLGVRIKGQGGALHSFYTDERDFMQKDVYYNGHFDILWNVTNYWGRYSPTRVFNFTPYAGIGYYYRNGSDQAIPLAGRRNVNAKQDGISLNSGLLFEFRVSKRVGIHLDIAGMLADDYFNRLLGGKRYEGVFSTTAGLTFHLGKTDFEEVVPMDYDLINQLNNNINSLRAEKDALARQLPCPKCPDVKPTPQPVVQTVEGAPSSINFRLGSASVDENQKTNIYNTAQFMKNSGKKIKVIGYADKKTGSAAVNMKLSEKRAKAVAKELVSKYNIPSQNIIVEWKGADEQPYSENNWNRVAIMAVE